MFRALTSHLHDSEHILYKYDTTNKKQALLHLIETTVQVRGRHLKYNTNI